RHHSCRVPPTIPSSSFELTGERVIFKKPGYDSEMDWTMFLTLQKPLYQALLFLALTPILILVIQPKSSDTAWVIAAGTFGVFLVVNAAMLWFDDSPWWYFLLSIGYAVGYLIIIALV